MAVFSFSSSNISRGTCAPGAASAFGSHASCAAGTCWCTTRRGVAARETSVPASAAPAAPESAASAARRPTKRRGGGGCCGSALEGASMAEAGGADQAQLVIDGQRGQATTRRERTAECAKPASLPLAGWRRRGGLLLAARARGPTCHSRALSVLFIASKRSCAVGRAQCFAALCSEPVCPGLHPLLRGPRAATRASGHGRERGNNAVSRASKAVHRGEQQTQAGALPFGCVACSRRAHVLDNSSVLSPGASGRVLTSAAGRSCERR